MHRPTLAHWAPTPYLFVLLGLFVGSATSARLGFSQDTEAEVSPHPELLTDELQLTFAGKRAGEGYFSQDGKLMVFQSEREPNNPFFQIYLMDRETGDTHRVSPGVGKTTCAWISPNGEDVIYASTQFDPQALEKQQAEIDFRNSGETKRYSWDYDETYDLVVFNTKTQDYTQLTHEKGYDAEGSYSPDGKLICFASNRRGYTGELSEAEQKLFEIDPASAMDLYIMNADGTDVRRLTSQPGYDGGPFFSPDGQQICWRRFTESGLLAEIMLMNVDGSQQRTLTHLNAMSWAPYFHPSGDYLVFCTNLQGFDNFELYMVDAAGKHEPVRVTYREGFDSLPVFTPDGESLVWTSKRGSSQSQLFEAKWDDAIARRLLGLDVEQDTHGQETELEAESSSIAAEAARATAAGFSAADIGRHVDYLCRPDLGGRLTGTAGERQATAYVAAYLENLGLEPAGQDGTFFHEFEFVSDVKLGPANALEYAGNSYKVDTRWRPVFFSKEGQIPATGVVCAGYGIVAPEEQGQEEYDSYVHLDVEGKWVLVFRQMPQDISPQRRQQLARYSGERYKAMVARDRGAAGIIFVSGPTSPLRQRLVPLQMDGTLGASSLAVLSVDDSVASAWMKVAQRDLKEVQASLDGGDVQMGFALEGVEVSAHIDVEPVTSRGRNVLALLPASEQPSPQMVLVGAHVDHLGNGQGGGSLAEENERGGVHRGADDNASGVAGMLEIAQYLADQVRSGLKMKRDVLFAAWSGEELGLRGSQAFADDFPVLYAHRYARAHAADPHAADPHATDPHATDPHATDPHATDPHATDPHATDPHATDPHATDPHATANGMPQDSLYPEIAACLNLDMVGRLREQLVLQGIGSSDYWTGSLERTNAVVRLSLVLQDDCYLPTDASTFFIKGVPILSAFTGSHSEYHTPRDTPETLNFEGCADIARLMALVTRNLVLADEAPNYKDQAAEPQVRANLTATLGTVPDYATDEVKGVLLGGVKKGAPAEKAGIQRGDIIIELAGKKIENIYDYTYAIEALKIGQETEIKLRRGDKTLTIPITPISRQ